MIQHVPLCFSWQTSIKLSYKYLAHIFDKVSAETIYSCKLSITLVFDSCCPVHPFFPTPPNRPPTPSDFLVKLSPPPTLVSLLVFLPSKWAAWEIKERNFTLCWKRKENYGQCQIIELVLRDALITGGDTEDVSVGARADSLSRSLMSCLERNCSTQTASSLRAGTALACVCTQFGSNWQNPIDRGDTFMHFYFLYPRQQCI